MRTFYGYPVVSGQEVVERHRESRARYAAALREERARVHAINEEHGKPFDAVLLNKIVRDNVARKLGAFRYVPFRPTSAAFRAAASERYAFGFSSWYNHLDTEYYSACGYDDYQGEIRDAAKATAVEYFRAWKYLKKEEGNDQNSNHVPHR